MKKETQIVSFRQLQQEEKEASLDDFLSSYQKACHLRELLLYYRTLLETSISQSERNLYQTLAEKVAKEQFEVEEVSNYFKQKLRSYRNM